MTKSKSPIAVRDLLSPVAHKKLRTTMSSADRKELEGFFHRAQLMKGRMVGFSLVPLMLPRRHLQTVAPISGEVEDRITTGHYSIDTHIRSTDIASGVIPSVKTLLGPLKDEVLMPEDGFIDTSNLSGVGQGDPMVCISEKSFMNAVSWMTEHYSLVDSIEDCRLVMIDDISSMGLTSRPYEFLAMMGFFPIGGAISRYELTDGVEYHNSCVRNGNVPMTSSKDPHAFLDAEDPWNQLKSAKMFGHLNGWNGVLTLDLPVFFLVPKDLYDWDEDELTGQIMESMLNVPARAAVDRIASKTAHELTHNIKSILDKKNEPVLNALAREIRDLDMKLGALKFTLERVQESINDELSELTDVDVKVAQADALLAVEEESLDFMTPFHTRYLLAKAASLEAPNYEHSLIKLNYTINGNSSND